MGGRDSTDDGQTEPVTAGGAGAFVAELLKRSPRSSPTRTGNDGRLNALTPGDFEAMRALLGELTGQELDPSVRVLPPFHTDGGRNLRFGRNVFVNHGCTAMDLGGIEIGDDVMIGPNVHLISSGHPVDPATRRSRITTAPIRIGRGVWIAAGAMVLQGVVVGDDAVVAAGAVVTRNVPPRTLAAGVPAQVIRELDP